MTTPTDEELLAFCLGDCSEAAHQNLSRRAAEDPHFGQRLVAMQAMTQALRTSPQGFRARRRWQRRPVRVALWSVLTLAFFVAGMLLQAHVGIFEASSKQFSEQSTEVSRALSWEGPADRVL